MLEVIQPLKRTVYTIPFTYFTHCSRGRHLNSLLRRSSLGSSRNIPPSRGGGILRDAKSVCVGGYHLNHLVSEILGQRNISVVWSFGSICVSKTYQQIRKLSNFGAKVCLTAVKLQMFGYQACHVCAQLEHIFLSHVHAYMETTVAEFQKHMKSEVDE